MTSRRVLRFVIGLGLLLIPLVIVMRAQSTTKGSQKPRPASHQPNQFHSEGERIFAQNCSRCHNAPSGFSSRISGTVVRHMRVRAQLSQHDEEELLRYFNP